MNLTIAVDGIDKQIGGTRIDLVASEAVASAREKLRQGQGYRAPPQPSDQAGAAAVAAPDDNGNGS